LKIENGPRSNGALGKAAFVRRHKRDSKALKNKIYLATIRAIFEKETTHVA